MARRALSVRFRCAVGALPVFDGEIVRWAIPQSRFEPQPMPSFNIPNQPKDAKEESVQVHGQTALDPRNGKALPEEQLKIGSDFFYPLHDSLHRHWLDLGC